jgi:TetR/AcrR family transcriptional repressor of nem operon
LEPNGSKQSFVMERREVPWYGMVMGRPREFCEEQALEGAMLVFWQKGYEAATLPDLLAGTRLSRGSFYKAFKDKHAVYLAALALYDRKVINPVIDGLRDSSRAIGDERIAALFTRLAKLMRRPEAKLGCFLCKAAVDMAPHDAAVERSVTGSIHRLEQAFATALEDPRNARPLRRKQAKDKASHLAATYLGIQVLRNAGGTPANVGAIVAQTLQGL